MIYRLKGENVEIMVDVIKKDYVAVITGAGAGIGATAAKHFSDAGMRLVLVDTNLKYLKQVAHTLSTEYRLIEGSVADAITIQKMYDVAFEAFGQVNLLFNNASISIPTSPWDQLDNWSDMMEVNFFLY